MSSVSMSSAALRERLPTATVLYVSRTLRLTKTICPDMRRRNFSISHCKCPIQSVGEFLAYRYTSAPTARKHCFHSYFFFPLTCCGSLAFFVFSGSCVQIACACYSDLRSAPRRFLPAHTSRFSVTQGHRKAPRKFALKPSDQCGGSRRKKSDGEIPQASIILFPASWLGVR